MTKRRQATVQPFADLIPDVCWTVFPSIRRTCRMSKNVALCMDVVGRVPPPATLKIEQRCRSHCRGSSVHRDALKERTMRLKTMLASQRHRAELSWRPRRAQAAPDRAEMMKQHRGGTLKLNAHGSAGTIDPQINYEVGVLAASLPHQRRARDLQEGRGQGFERRRARPRRGRSPSRRTAARPMCSSCVKGVKFSTGKEVTPADVVATFERIFKVSSPTAGSFYNGIVGADACLKDGRDLLRSRTASSATTRPAPSRST